MKRKELEQLILLEVQSNAIEAGITSAERGRATCPSCCATDESSLGWQRTDDGGLRYRCYRASCGIRGYIPLGAGGVRSKNERATGGSATPRKRKEFKGELRELEESEAKLLETRFGIQRQVLQKAGVKYSPDRQRYWYPIYNILGYEIGGTARSYRPDAVKKAIAYPDNTNHPLVSWYLPFKSGPLVIVEDQVSAIKVSKVSNSLALLGTHMPLDVVKLLQNLKPSRIILALDPDATSTALQIAGYYGLFLGNLSVAILSKDPKDMSYEEIRRNILGEAGDCGSGSQPVSVGADNKD